MSFAPQRTIVGEDGTINPTMRFSAGGAAVGQTVVQFTGNPSIATGATVVLTTVPAGKTLFITDVYVGANTATPFLVQIQAAGTTILFAYAKGDTGPVVLPGLETQPQATAGQAVQIVLGTAAATTAAYFISGFIQ